MKSSQQTTKTPESRSFAPFVAKTLEIQGDDDDFYHDSVSYNEKYNLIIACPADKSIQFNDATTLLPSEEFETQKLDYEFRGMAFCAETETFIFGCEDGNIFSYNLSNKTLKKLGQSLVEHISGLAFMNSSYFAFSGFLSFRLHVGNLENKSFSHSPMGESDINDLESLPERNLLFSSLISGSMIMYRTDRLPKLSLLYSIQKDDGRPKKLQRITISKKDYILTSKSDFTIEMWHIVKGKMKRIKVIRMSEKVLVSHMIYLENYKMIGTTHDTNKIRFWRLPSGKLEWKLDVGMDECYHSFLMKDKNSLGFVAGTQKLVKIVQLYPSE